MAKQSKIIVSVTNDLITDNRVHKVCTTLTKMGFYVLLVGRVLPQSPSLNEREYQCKRMHLFFKSGPLFYAEYNFRLFFLLMFSRFDLLLANDLDTLAANFLTSKIKQKPLIYDSHEYFTEVPELINRPRIQAIWGFLESKIVPKLKYAYTVCSSISNIYTEKYAVDFKVVRNVPSQNFVPLEATKTNDADKIVLYQGAVNIGRGLKQAILAMQSLDRTKLIIAGDGDIKSELENLVVVNSLQGKVEFAGRLPFDKLAELTATADLGLSIEEDLGLNYRFALPNKLFDYIQANVPLLITDLPEMHAIVQKYKIGEITTSLEPEVLAQKIKTCLNDSVKRKTWKENLKVAAKELVWEREEEVLIDIFSRFLK